MGLRRPRRPATPARRRLAHLSRKTSSCGARRPAQAPMPSPPQKAATKPSRRGPVRWRTTSRARTSTAMPVKSSAARLGGGPGAAASRRCADCGADHHAEGELDAGVTGALVALEAGGGCGAGDGHHDDCGGDAVVEPALDGGGLSDPDGTTGLSPRARRGRHPSDTEAAPTNSASHSPSSGQNHDRQGPPSSTVRGSPMPSSRAYRPTSCRSSRTAAARHRNSTQTKVTSTSGVRAADSSGPSTRPTHASRAPTMMKTIGAVRSARASRLETSPQPKSVAVTSMIPVLSIAVLRCGSTRVR